jgi:hypothetical protein
VSDGKFSGLDRRMDVAEKTKCAKNGWASKRFNAPKPLS